MVQSFSFLYLYFPFAEDYVSPVGCEGNLSLLDICQNLFSRARVRLWKLSARDRPPEKKWVPRVLGASWRVWARTHLRPSQSSDGFLVGGMPGHLPRAFRAARRALFGESLS